MSVDFYAVNPADSWPSQDQMQQCIAAEGYPITLERFPVLTEGKSNDNGVLLQLVEGSKVYLEGSLAHRIDASDTAETVNQNLTPVGLEVGAEDVIISFRTRSIQEIQGASYIMASLIMCFDGFGFESQGNTGGKGDFATGLLQGVQLLQGVSDQ